MTRRGSGILRACFYTPRTANPASIKIVQLRKVATKGDFFNINKMNLADMLEAQRIPFQLMGEKPENVGLLAILRKLQRCLYVMN